jgi:hypothetical protein
MLLWVGIALFVVAGFVALRWSRTRTDSLGRARPFPWISTVILILLGATALAPGLLRARLEHRLTVAATTIVGSPVEVHCQSFGEAFVDAGGELGYVAFGPDGRPEPSTLIKRSQCRDLSSYLRSDKSAPSREQVVAVHVLTHEAIHMIGVTSEADTECVAMQRDAQMAHLLGASTEDARALAIEYWERIYPLMPAPYRSDECGPGLALDAGLHGAPWEASTAAN